ncbi:hypothetical protein [Gordonia sp. SL306]|uniref:hypothetical protein n=1 Tax=Gordonia sp. SL306 TaxID=2995145 RepID=UPI00226E8EF1|nr:hypothetical protein [Gordonia sp. SL306]WAC57596.1 hypothetical protein OVA31_10355 [Gordonia sp. SL306]
MAAVSENIEEAAQQVEYKVASFQNQFNNDWKGEASDAASEVAERSLSAVWDLNRIHGTAASAAARLGPELDAGKRSIDSLVRVIEAGDLYVDEVWTVLVRPKLMKPAMARLMSLAAQGFQDQLNPRLVELGETDRLLAEASLVQSVAFGIEAPSLHDDANAPADVVPDLWNERGRKAQQSKLEEHMIGTIVDKAVVTKDGKTITTLGMLDGSKQVYTDVHRGGEGNTFDLYNEKGRLFSTKTTHADGSSTTTFMREGQSPLVVTEKNGKAVAKVDGVELPVPSTDNVAQSLAGAGMAALEPHVADGLPFLSAEQATKLEVGAKNAGPALTIISTGVNIANAKDGYDACVAGTTGGVSLAGDMLVTATAPEGLAARQAFARAFGGGLLFGTVGNLVGQMVCR